MAVLGTGQNEAWIYARGGNNPVGPLPGAVEVEWSRNLDEPSDAHVVVGIPGASAECCAMLGLLGTWGHELVVFRDGVRVWEGPITRLTWKRDSVRIDAQDVLSFLVRRVHRGRSNATLLSVVSEIVTDMTTPGTGFTTEDNVIPYLDQHPQAGDPQVTREVLSWSIYTLDGLGDLIKAGGHMATIGRRVEVWSQVHTLSRTARLLPDEHMSTDVEVVEDGLALATYVITQNDVPETNGSDAGAGGLPQTDPFYGRVEQRVSQADLPDVEALRQAAIAYRQSSFPAPMRVNVPGGAVLSCDAPFDISELIAGATVPVGMDSLCKKVATTQLLTGLVVTQGESGEQVKITLEPISGAQT